MSTGSESAAPGGGSYFPSLEPVLGPARYMGGAAALVGLGIGLRNYFATPRRARHWSDIALPAATLGLGVGIPWALMNASLRAAKG